MGLGGAEKAPREQQTNRRGVVFVLFTFEMTCTSLGGRVAVRSGSWQQGYCGLPALPLEPVFQPSALGAIAIDKLHVEKSKAAQQNPGTRMRGQGSVVVASGEGEICLDTRRL
jgi:hypothetical protein